VGVGEAEPIWAQILGEVLNNRLQKFYRTPQMPSLAGWLTTTLTRSNRGTLLIETESSVAQRNDQVQAWPRTANEGRRPDVISEALNTFLLN